MQDETTPTAEPGYYVRRTERTDEWPYIRVRVVSGPFAKPRKNLPPEEDCCRWDGARWVR